MPARQKDRYRIFEAKPAMGGALVTRGSLDNCGSFNYSVKRDWRRDLDVEQRREGHDYFYPNVTLTVGGQPFPSQIQLDSLTVAGGVATATRAGGQWFQVGETVIISGATDLHYNGIFIVTAVTSTTFQFSAPGSVLSPDPSTAIFAQADEAITLLALARRPNGQTAVIAGSQHRLYRYFALEDPSYISHDPADYPFGTAADQLSYWSDGTRFPADQNPALWSPGNPVSQMQYVDENPGYWIVIGSGYSDLGKRWEVVSLNGYMVFNNGVDLLCTYRVEEMSVVPIYELREQGIVSIGTIAEINGILLGGDITEIVPDKVPNWFQTAGRLALDSLTFDVPSMKVTATRAAGHPFVVGQPVTISGALADDYNGTHVISDITPTTFKYLIDTTPASPDPALSPFVIATQNTAPYGIYPYQENLTRTTFRVLWGTPGEPRRWAAIFPGSIDAGSNVLRLAYPVLSLSPGMELTIVGAGASHAGGTADNMTGVILYVSGASVVLDSFAETTVVRETVQASDSLGSIVGYEDLQDDGSGIIKMLPLADQLVIYKDTSIFLGQYLGNTDQPFAFLPRRIQKEQGLFYRHTLWLVETPSEMFHVYAGRNSFYRFDLTNQQPMLLPHFESCSNLFYSQATLANTERIFAAENGITHEILFVFPSTNPLTFDDKMLCWDYKQDTLSTSGVEISAGATVRKPITGLTAGAEEDWFLMGMTAGTVVLYGKTNIPQQAPDWSGGSEIFYRRDANPYVSTKNPYQSLLASGMGAFGNDFAEKDCRYFLPLWGSQSPNTPVTVTVYGCQNTNRAPTLIGTQTFVDPQTQNLMPMLARQFYFQSSISITGIDNPARLVGTLWNVAGIDSRSLSRG